LFGGTTAALFDVVSNSFTDNYYAYQDGTLGSKQESVLLPFTPVSGYVYTLSASLTLAKQRVAPVRLCDGFAARRLGSPTTKRSGDSNEIEPVILVGYGRGPPSARGLAKIALAWKADTRSALGFGGGVGPQSWSEPHLTDVGPGLQRAQTAGGGDQDATTVGAEAPSWIR
jgi:hypothetical protein